MKRIKNQDWIRVLQERLQDAALPLETDFAALDSRRTESARRADGNYFSDKFAEKPISAPLSTAGQSEGPSRRTVWWPWALAGAAAALAAVLFLRPTPEGVKPAPAGGPLIAQNAEIVAPVGNDVDGSAGGRRVAPGEHFRSEARTSSSAPQGEARRRPQEMEPEPPAAGEIPDQVGDDRKVGDDSGVQEDGKVAVDGPVTPLGELAQAGLPEEPGESGRAARRPRLALHLQATSGGASGSGGWGSKPMTLVWSETRTEIHQAYYGFVQMSDSVPFITGSSSDKNYNSSNLGGKAVRLMDVVDSKTVIHEVAPAPALPISFGLSGELALDKRWSLLAGLEYTQRAGYRMNGTAPQALTLHYLGVPLETRFHFLPEQRFRLYLGAGLKAEKCILAKGGEPLKDPVLFSGNLQAGADFRLVPGVRIYLAPVFSQYLNRSAYANGWDVKPQFSVRAGLSFDL